MAAVLAGGVTFVVFRKLRASVAHQQVTQIVAAAKDLPMGATLTANDIVMVDWPTNMPLAGSFSKAEAVIGKPVVH
jgi:Flp pilus assembly protein CpaB